MALPKEPRQKMINLMYLVLTALLALNVSSEILNAFKTVDTSLKASSTSLAKSNSTIYTSLEEKMAKAETQQKAAIWKPKADQAKKLSDDFYNYIESLKTDLIKESGGKPDGTYKEDDLNASSRMFITNGKGAELEKRIKDYREAMLNIDPTIRKEFEATLPIDANPIIGQDGTKKPFDMGYFNMNPTVASVTLLSKFQNNVKNAENQVVTYCHNQIGQVAVHMDQVGILVGQSSNYLMPGQELSVTAGVGAYSSKASPSISINGSSVQVNGGQGIYKTTVSGGGEHSIPVSVTFTDENGQKQTKTETVKYTVGTPGGAAVMLDKMNVLYIGVDNPVTIGSPAGWDKTSVSMSGGSISGSNDKRTVRVSSPGAASITVTADGKSANFPFRVFKIPDPIFKIGDGKIRMPVTAFKQQQYCRAELENFYFDLKYSVVGATVYFGGAGFPNTVIATLTGNNLAGLQQYIQRCQPGSNVAFENIRVSGPDGVRQIDSRAFALY